MRSDAETRAIAGLAAVVSGVMLAGASGLTFVVGWTLWGVGLAVVLAAIPPAGETGHAVAAECGLPTRRAGCAARQPRGPSAPDPW